VGKIRRDLKNFWPFIELPPDLLRIVGPSDLVLPAAGALCQRDSEGRWH
jgi:hypothetical protein